MKKKIRKLALTKETLRSLEERNLNEAAGAATEYTAPTCPPNAGCGPGSALCTVSRRCSDCCVP